MVLFREAKPEDAALIAELRQKVWASTYRGIYPDEMIDNFDFQHHSAMTLKEINDQLCHVFIIEFNSNAAGYLIFKDHAQLYLRSLYLLKKYQCKGAGTAAFEFVREHCRRKGMCSIRCQCSPHNIGAMAFYEKMGGRITRRDEGHSCMMEDTVWFEFDV